MPLNTHYDSLKVARNAPIDVIRAAYKVLAQRYHPDKNPSPDAQRIMKTINAAYDVLSDPRRRAEYDAWIDEQSRTEGLNAPLHKARTEKSDRYTPPHKSTSTPSPPPTASDTPRRWESHDGGGTGFGIWTLLLGSVFLILLWESGLLQKKSVLGQGVSESNAMVVSSSASLQQAMVQPQSALPSISASLGQQLPDKTPSGTLSIEHSATDENRILLPLICERRNIAANECKHARNYPGGEECSVELKPDLFEGRFLSPNSSTIIVRYLSDCEGHTQHFGGSVVFEKHDRAIAFVGYFPGFVLDECTPITKGAGTENLICTTSTFEWGYFEREVGEVKYTRDIKGMLKVSYDPLPEIARDSHGQWGANYVSCNDDFQLFSLNAPKSGPAPDTAIVEASYADAATIRKACAPDAEARKIQALEPPPPGSAYVDDRNIKRGQFVVDLTTRKITPVSEYRRR